ncbi:MAG: NUDIX domain-containing protein [Mycobacteriaceae bacterium]
MSTNAEPASYRDSAGRTLNDYPRPSVAVDTAVLTVPDGESILFVLQVLRAGSHARGSWALPGTFLHEHEQLSAAVTRSLRAKAGIAGRRPTQLHVFDDPARDERGWVLSVAHLDLVPYAKLAAVVGDDVRLVPVDAAGPLPYDHPEILARAVDTVRARYSDRPDPDRLLSKTFTLRELHLVHEAVAGRRLPRDTFRRTMEGQLRATGRMAAGTRGRPARLFRQV